MTTDERISRLEGAYEQVNERLGEIRSELSRMNQLFEGRFDTMDARFDTMNARFDAMNASTNSRFDAINGRFDAQNASINRRFDAQNRVLLAGIGLILAAVVGLSFV